ncbi:hypothetical protein E1301_Tti009447 [Triplophysa tibetana]|uniref:V-SNARE coiled-coil homology domain-containing protein n=1 Tax=Triplophysa tibetana TaxID=1572043 RepID=A0A5A9P3L9_9TELE|nr:hypothetical protein E1301_Tti009447 [Triplophysa tibetana]
MDKIESAHTEVDEVKAIMLENVKKAEERRDNLSDLDQRAEHLQNGCKDLEKAVNLKKNRMMEYLRANKGLVIVVLVSAIIIFAVVVAMLATQDIHGHGHPEVHGDLENP